MIRIVTARHLQELTHRLVEAESGFSACHERAEALAAELAEVRSELLGAREDGGRLLAELAERSLEVTELVAEVKAAEQAPRRVYVLTHHGELHSVHLSEDAAQARAVGEDANIENWKWKPTPPNTPLLQSTWRITTLVLPREEATL